MASAPHAGAGGTAGKAIQQSSSPMFEAFWQGRLIPGARIDSLPFIEVCTYACCASFDSKRPVDSPQVVTLTVNSLTCSFVVL